MQEPSNPSRRAFLRKSALGLIALSAAPTLGADLRADRSAPDESPFLFVPRAAWADRPPRLDRLYGADGFNRLTIHHTGAQSNFHTNRNAVHVDLDGIMNGHMNLNYGDIGYHLMIDYAGRVWEGHSLDYEGAHVGRHNRGNIGVMLLGNFERQEPAPSQVAAMGRLSEQLRMRFAISRHEIYGHRDLGHSLCPGRLLYPEVQRLKAKPAGS